MLTVVNPHFPDATPKGIEILLHELNTNYLVKS